jgi:Domain of unknown function (DUF3601)
MWGPFPSGQFAKAGASPFQHLEPGRRYTVAQPFADFDGEAHPAGESWTYLGYNFVPYDDGLSLFVSLDGTQEWQIRLCWRPENQGAIIDALGDHVRPAA